MRGRVCRGRRAAQRSLPNSSGGITWRQEERARQKDCVLVYVWVLDGAYTTNLACINILPSVLNDPAHDYRLQMGNRGSKHPNHHLVPFFKGSFIDSSRDRVDGRQKLFFINSTSMIQSFESLQSHHTWVLTGPSICHRVG